MCICMCICDVRVHMCVCLCACVCMHKFAGEFMCFNCVLRMCVFAYVVY